MILISIFILLYLQLSIYLKYNIILYNIERNQIFILIFALHK